MGQHLGRVFRAGADWAERVEAPTWLLILLIYGGWVALTLAWTSLPTVVILPAGAWLCAWHMSLQHELMHGHPTRNAALNAALAWPPLNLWLPYALYRESHLRHHRAPVIADPLEDPESTYATAAEWAKSGWVSRALHRLCTTLPGRMLIGPPRTVLRFWAGQARRMSERATRRIWINHCAGVALLLAWIVGACHIPLAAYLLCFVYPGTSLILIRSLAEHRAAERPEERTVVVERAGLLGLLFLNNNLHVLHHQHPSIPWYRLPAVWREARPSITERNVPICRSYLDIARRFGVRPTHSGVYPAFVTAQKDG